MKLTISRLSLITVILLAIGGAVFLVQQNQERDHGKSSSPPISAPLDGQAYVDPADLVKQQVIPAEESSLLPADWQPNEDKLQSVLSMTTGQLLTSTIEDTGDWLEAYQSGVMAVADVDGVKEAIAMQSLAGAYAATQKASYLEAFRRGVDYFQSKLRTSPGERATLTYVASGSVVQSDPTALYALGYLDLAAAGVVLSTEEQQTVLGMIEYIAASWDAEAVAFNDYYLDTREIGCKVTPYYNGYALAVLTQAFVYTQDRYYLNRAELAARALMEVYGQGNVREDKNFFLAGSRALLQLFELTGSAEYRSFLLLLTESIPKAYAFALASGASADGAGMIDADSITGIIGILPFLQQEDPVMAAGYTDILISLFPNAILVSSDQGDAQDLSLATVCPASSCGSGVNVSTAAMMLRAAVLFQKTLTDAQLEHQVILKI